MALGLCAWRRAAGTVRRRANIVLRQAIPVVPAASACGVAESIPHLRITLRVGRHLRKGELLGANACDTMPVMQHLRAGSRAPCVSRIARYAKLTQVLRRHEENFPCERSAAYLHRRWPAVIP